MPRKQLTSAVPEQGNDGGVQVELTLHVRPRRQQSRGSGPPEQDPDTERRARIPRVTRLMALAIKFQDMVDRGEVRDYADLARLGYVTRARITQIMNLLNLAPDIQQLLLDGSVATGVTERAARNLTQLVCWYEQRERFKKMLKTDN